MIYWCPSCGRGYTIPVGDHLIEKKSYCLCGNSSRQLKMMPIQIMMNSTDIISNINFSGNP